MPPTPGVLPSEFRIRRSPLPDRARHPLILLLVVALPQGILIALNLRAYFLMSGEMTVEQVRLGGLLFAFELGLLFGTAAFAWRLMRRGCTVPWGANWAVCLPHAGYLAALTLAITEGRIIPRSVEQWIVPSGQLLFYQWVFVMPALFYSVLALSCYPTKRGRWFEILSCSAATAGIPLLWYLSLQTLHGLNLPATAIVTLAVGSSLLCVAGLLRLVTMLYVWADRATILSQMLLALVLGLIGPLGGLMLNRHVPFPTDFQSPWIYALAVLNGLFLAFPMTNRLVVDRVVWLGRCVLLPFTLYFFLVFLPFLPLAIPAMMFLGAGFLLLVPTALAIVHLRAILRTGALEIREGWGKKSVGFAIAAACLMPAVLMGAAVLDRLALHQAMNYVFAPDFRKSSVFPGSLRLTRHALEHLRNQKAASYLPFLTEAYEQIVFDGLMLGEPKIQALHQALFGHVLAPAESKGLVGFRNVVRGRVGSAARPFPHDVRLGELTVTSRIEQGCTVTSAVLHLENQLPEQAEYIAKIQLPPGVLVSGYWLQVGEERVPGRIFEKKTAMWVYQMIRDVTRRDPGLLIYTGPESLELRIFPFSGREKRITGIEFLSPPGLQATVRIGDRPVEIASPSAGSTLVRFDSESRLIVPAAAAAMLPELKRRPYPHFIVDRSMQSAFTPDRAVATMRRVAAFFPEVKNFRATAANYELSDLSDGLHPAAEIEKLGKVPKDRWLPTRGGFLFERAIKRGLLQYEDAFATAAIASPWFESYPIFVVITESSAVPAADSDLAWFSALVPDAAGYFSANESGRLEPHRVDGASGAGDLLSSQPVRIFRAAGRLGLMSGSGLVRLSGEARPMELEVFDPGGPRFEPVTDVRALEAESRYARGLAALAWGEEMVENPSLAKAMLPGVIRASRASGVLVPASAYIVVENSAQWKMLKMKEGQKLGSQKDLDFMETPEPSVAMVALIAAAWHLRRRPQR